MTTRRNVLRSIPAAIALAILPSRLTSAERAQEERADGIAIYGVPAEGWIENTLPEPMALDGMRVPTWVDQERDIVAYVDRCVEIANWTGGRSYMMHSDGDSPRPWDPGYDHILIPTDDGDLYALPGDWIAKVGDRFVVVRD